MTMWRPDAASLRRPIYLSLAGQVVQAVAEGRLQAGARLPPHRQMAGELGVSVQTVSRAYEELAQRGLLAGEVGRGSFIRAPHGEANHPYIPERLKELIDLSILKPVCEPLHLQHMKAALAELSETLPANVALSFRPNAGFERHRTVGAEWLRRCGVTTAPGTVLLTNGATAGMTIALMTAAPPGSTMVTEEIGHHTLGPLASYLGIRLRGVKIDEEGLHPDALDEACRDGDVRALFVMPSPVNPTASMMGPRRREQIAEVARRRGLIIVENDPLGPLLDQSPPPLAALAPERTLHVTSLTKCIMPGLRTGYLAVPERLLPAVANRLLVTSWMATGLVAEIATRWIESGLAAELVRWQRDALRGRQGIVADALRGVPHNAHPAGLHAWLPLPSGRTEQEFVSYARLRGVAIAPGSAFTLSDHPQPPAVRVSVGSTTAEELRRGLEVVLNLVNSDPEPVLLSM